MISKDELIELPPGKPSRWDFGDCVFDELKRELRRGGSVVELEPRPMDILLYLLRHAGESVTRDELLNSVWGHAHLSENALSNAVGKLRRAIGDDAQTAILTVHRIGYRLVTPVRCRQLVPVPAILKLLPGQPVPLRPGWNLQSRLGSGSQGEVWLAGTTDPSMRRVFKFSADGARLGPLKRESTLSRLLYEQLGPRADLVPVIDWNFDEAPFFLECEYGGINLSMWVEQQGGFDSVDLVQRLDFARRIAETVAAAHSIGVLHKDLKPDNILVDRDAEGRWIVRLIDFGSGGLTDPARLADLGGSRLGDGSTQSRNQVSGTPMYLAPELLLGHAPTVQSDIYALGVILYQLLIGDLRHPMAAGWEREIDDELLRDDIGAAAAGKPAARLASAQELADRLASLNARHRLLTEHRIHEQSLRDAEASLLRVRTRRPWLITAVAALSIGLALSLWFFRQSEIARADAMRQYELTQSVNAFLNDDLLSAADPNVAGTPNVTVMAAVRGAAEKIDLQLKDSPQTAALLHSTIGNAYRTIGDYAAAESEYKRAVDLSTDSVAPSTGFRDENQLLLAQMLAYQNRYDEAEQLIQRVDRRSESLANTMIPARLWDVRALLDRHRSDLLAASQNGAEAQKAVETLRQLHQQVYRANRRSVALILLHAAQNFQDAGRYADAEAIEHSLIADGVARGVSAEPITIRARLLWTENRIEQNRIADLPLEIEQIKSDAHLLLGSLNPVTLQLRRIESMLASRQNQCESAIAKAQSTTEGTRKLFGQRNDTTVQSMIDGSRIYAGCGMPTEAAQQLSQAYDIATELQGQNGLLPQIVAFELGSIATSEDNAAEARQWFDRASVEALQRGRPAEDWPSRYDFERGRLAVLDGNRVSAKALLLRASSTTRDSELSSKITKILATL